MKGVKIFMADGFEETEALTTVDMLRRAGIDVQMVAVNMETAIVTGSHGVSVLADCSREEFEEELVENGTCAEDVMIFPGGMPGTTNLAADEDLMELMLRHYAQGGTVAGICAAPALVLSKLPGLAGKRMTCYEGMQQPLLDLGVDYTRRGHEVDGNIISGRGAGCTIGFALAIASRLVGEAAAERVRESIMHD